MKLRVLLLALILGLVLAGRAGALELRVFAAASLSDSLTEIAQTYAAESGDQITLNFGASSLLARQIEEGAPADLFFSADEAKMDALEKKGRIVPETRRSHLGNALVVVVPSDSQLALNSAQDLAGAAVKRLALAEPKTVPAGIYAKAYLTRLKLWPAIEPKVIPTENVRAALAAVKSGNVDAGIVYKTDVIRSHQIKVAFEIPAEEGPIISYPVALVKDSKQPAAARKFLLYLESPAALKVFQNHGFLVRD